MSDPNRYDGMPFWINEILPPTEEESFDLSLITPATIKRTLKHCRKSSSPGDDGVSYLHLWKLPACHQFLATLYSTILFRDRRAPRSWCQGCIKLIHKGGDTSIPSNYRPIALTSVIGKLLHKILATRLERYLILNGVINKSVQKGFLHNTNGVIEHIMAMNAILDEAATQKRSVAITMLDLSNAFGSISHRYLSDILNHCKIPVEVTQYIEDCYSKLTAYVKSKQWSTSLFGIRRGVFQGDPLSSTIFLLAFAPITKLVEKWKYPGFSFVKPIPEAQNLPRPEATIYLLWDEKDSDEAKGWYKRVVKGYDQDGNAQVQYLTGSMEILKLQHHKWVSSRKNGKKYIPKEESPPMINNPKTAGVPIEVTSSEHKGKAYADDLTIINVSENSHQEALYRIDEACRSLHLHK